MDNLYRTMRMDDDGQPATGRSARSLGVRVSGPHADVHPGEKATVNPGSGGMSVTIDDPSLMPVFRRPRWLRDGGSEDPLFVLKAAVVVPPLRVATDGGAHGLVEPAITRRLSDYEHDLVLTRPHWRRLSDPRREGV